MKKEFLSEIKRMQQLAGIVIEENMTRADLMQQDNGDDLNSLINQDLEVGDNIQKFGNLYGTQDSHVNTNKVENEDEYDITGDYQDEAIGPVAVDTVEDTPAELDAHAKKTLYPGPYYKGMYSGERMMEDISSMKDDDLLFIF